MNIAIDRNRRKKISKADNLQYINVRAAIPPQNVTEKGSEDKTNRDATININKEIEIESDDKKDNKTQIESETRIKIDLDDITS